MGGKASLLVILGFSTIMLMVGMNMNRVSSGAVDNSTKHYESAMAIEIARSGINLASSNLSRDPGWGATNSPYSYMGNDNLDIVITDTADTKIITSTASYKGITKTIEVKINLASFSEYAYFSNEEGNIWWTGSDSVWGPFHTNDDVQVQGHPYFDGPTTSHSKKMKYYKNAATDEPTVVGTYSPNTTIDIPKDGISNLAKSAANGGYIFSGNKNVFMKFAGDSIKYRFDNANPYTTVLAKDLAPKGVIYVEDGNLHLEGTVKNRWSVGSNKSVYLTDDILYSDVPDPKNKHDSSNDLLGILANKDIIITNNTANATSIDIHASMYCEKGGFKAEKYKSRPAGGSINLLGGVTQAKRGAVGRFKVAKNGTKTMTSGFSKDYKYDSRLQRMVPPYFPSTNTFKILSWLE